jgi:preprotein translocase subunit YajC
MSVGNRVKLKSGEVGKIVKVLNGNFFVMLNNKKNKWVSPDQIAEVLPNAER